jgi:hypothetical protein
MRKVLWMQQEHHLFYLSVCVGVNEFLLRFLPENVIEGLRPLTARWETNTAVHMCEFDAGGSYNYRRIAMLERAGAAPMRKVGEESHLGPHAAPIRTFYCVWARRENF